MLTTNAHFQKKGVVFEFCENDARFPWVKFVDVPRIQYIFTKNAHFQKRASFLWILRKWRTFPMGVICRFPQEFTRSPRKTHMFRKGKYFCEFCEQYARFPWVEFVDFPKNSLNVNEKRTCSGNSVIFANSAKMAHVSQG